jgi:hypothetical protein
MKKKGECLEIIKKNPATCAGSRLLVLKPSVKKDLGTKGDDAALLHGPAPGGFLTCCKTTA